MKDLYAKKGGERSQQGSRGLEHPEEGQLQGLTVLY